MTELLTDRDIEDARLAEWTVDGKSLTRTVELASFPAAIQAVNRVAEAAEEADHHPDIDIRWRTLTFTLSTHSAGVEPAGTTQKKVSGLTQKDVDLARRIDALIAT
ncbi:MULTISPECIES: 4a-hydroxytetrahydrobiopterin dehydratase [unclassified Rhodococcus (in: high G+C Gram-positive bacteria)]|uniref:4a-hydroxytetrahydrobiopterin dehydratase n=1 Tax=unclassified Rhodococcus (in: high G+C Gram-positive bacteria) TaxID=192944 RepID=UPI0007BB4067|nr:MULTISPECIES: 4a-hydroxytetrahydrobiopterin dehydratase [unclassified Rhodococcus (in: high G+C Gram-positive bacteria)]KZF00345.1 4a-hydroxytetrahydrobiopterin dehydratase [Rhodococcus sp. EPR-147]KZF01844.1 4a-hydroxytetrahydrobiopterin dehydratase [Rhodococcus sp. EPR-279]MDV7991091.1 4a-hydroxytetrahydrobiopterin dehydratase [Rhodococcus sp. IEGM 1374]OZE33257.1 4a-hydroxytetrahydrobiopterin dehydratase [Rhodococcus sp. 05-2254-4]OZE43539.1 4a-hydroxytetrahydrobiopterin dehydratase [Rho